MIAQELEVSLHMAFVEARQKRHEFISVEPLLLALLDNPTAAEALRGCAANIEELRKALGDFITAHTPTVTGTGEIDTQPTLGFQRVIQRAILHVQSSGKKEVTGANVLVAIFGEKDSHAVYFLHQQGVTRLDVVNYISHGITKTPASKEAKRGGEAEQETAGDEQQSGGALETYTLNLNAQALVGKIDPLIGREREIERVIQTLRRRRFGRDARRFEPSETGALFGCAEMHRRDDLQRVPPRVRKGSCAIAALPEDRRARAFRRGDGRDPARPEITLRGAPRHQIQRQRAHQRRRTLRPLHQRPALARQGDRCHR